MAKHVWRVVSYYPLTKWDWRTSQRRSTGRWIKRMSSKKTEGEADKDVKTFNQRWQRWGGWAYYGEREA